jgi:hypothetical protein
LDINAFAIELAKVSMMIGRKLAIDELHIADEKDLPLDNLDANFVTGDALVTVVDGPQPGVIPTAWPPADVIIGNPPFVEARNITVERGRNYVANLRELYHEIPGRADYCVYWFRRAHDHLPSDGRAGLVGTKTIRQNYSREGGLDYIVANGGTITEAVSTQPWSGDAAVDVSIVNWTKQPVAGKKRLYLPELGHSGERLHVVEVTTIPSSLSGGTDVTRAAVLKIAKRPKRCFEGQQPGHVGFRLTAGERAALLSKEPASTEVTFPYIIGDDLITRGSSDSFEYIIDMGERDLLEASKYKRTLEILKTRVLPTWTRNAEQEREDTGEESGEHQGRLEAWWLLKRRRGDLMRGIAALPRYIACVRHTKRPIFVFLVSSIHPDSALTVFSFADDYSFGILQSATHWTWFTARCSTISARFRYTSQTVFDTFPWPQSPTAKQIKAVATAAVKVRQVRAKALKMTTGGLRAVYRTLELPGRHRLKDAHAALDAAVLAAYGFDAKKDLLAQLLELNLAVAAKEKAGEKVTPPGVPPSYGDAKKLLTEDCISP